MYYVCESRDGEIKEHKPPNLDGHLKKEMNDKLGDYHTGFVSFRHKQLEQSVTNGADISLHGITKPELPVQVQVHNLEFR